METLAAYRDDGPLGEAIRAAAGRLRLPSTPMALVALVALVTGLAVDRARPGAATVVGVAAFVVTAAAGTPRPQRLAWLTPPTLRLGEYAFVVALVAAAEPSASPAAFGLVAAVAFHHYDVVYRLRHQKLAPPAWLLRLGLGWSGRMVVLLVFAVAGVLRAGAFALAAVLAVLFVSESVASWIRVARDSTRTLSMGTGEDDDE